MPGPEGKSQFIRNDWYPLTCFSDFCFNFRWMMTEWTPCSRTCGKGMQSRQVACTQQLSNGTLVRARERDCAGPKPASAQRCEGQDCMTVWEAGVWSEVQYTFVYFPFFYFDSWLVEGHVIACSESLCTTVDIFQCHLLILLIIKKKSMCSLWIILKSGRNEVIYSLFYKYCTVIKSIFYICFLI